MQNILSNLINMIRATLLYLTNNAAATAGIVNFAPAKAIADNKLVLIDQLTQIAEGTSIGVTLDTNAIRQAMTLIAFRICSALRVYAADTANNTLMLKVRYTLSDFRDMKKEEIDDICQTIHDEADTNIAAAGGYGYLASDVTDLQTAIDLYRTSMQNPRQAIISKTQAIKQIKLISRDIVDNSFKERMDNMVNTLITVNPVFVSGYRQAREIINLGATTAKVRGTIKNAEEVPLVGVTFTIRKTGQLNKTAETTSGTGGKFGIADLLPDNYDFTWQYPGYQTITETNVHISAGKEIRRNITMQLVTGQTITVQGIVRNEDDNSLIAGAVITVGGYSTVSQTNGSYFLQFPPAASPVYAFTISANGYDTITGTYTIQPGQTNTQDIFLEPAALPPTGSVSGLVTASNTGNPIGGAFVQLTPGNYSTNADPMGSYSINNVPTGNYTLTASAPGFASNQHSITINPNSNTNDNISLNPIP